EPGKSLRPSKDFVDGAQHIGAGAKRVAEAHMAKLVLDGSGQGIERAMHDLEFARSRPLERENRLLLVAHRKDRATDGARAGAGEKFAGETADDFPLLGAGVLRFVDQDVVDTLVELVMHPSRPLLAEQRQRFFDQIVVIELSAPVLAAW